MVESTAACQIDSHHAFLEDFLWLFESATLPVRQRV
jgi:hypothetical protein